jgi:hypothetical protein
MLEGLIIVCEGIVFVPLARKPVIPAGTAVAVQVNVVAATFDDKITALVLLPVQMVSCIGVLITFGAGLTFTT